MACCAHRVQWGGDKKKMMREIETSGCVVLACRSCGERTVLIGRASDWYREGRVAFACGGGGCERNLTLADRVGQVHLDMAGLAPGPHY